MYSILIVDDEYMIREGIRKVIPWEKLEIDRVYTAASAAEALSIIREHKPKLMITDISMPETTGLELIEQARGEVPDIRILVLTGYERFDYARDCLRLHVQDFLLKPIDEELLYQCIQREVDALKEQEKKEEEAYRKRAANAAEQLALEAHLLNLIHGEKREESLAYIREHYPELETRSLTVAILMPKLYLEDQQQENVLHLQQIRTVCLGVLDSEGLGITLLDAKRGQIEILSFENLSGAYSSERMEGLLEILRDEFGYLPRIVIGNPVAGIGEIDTSYSDAVCLWQEQNKNDHSVLQRQSVINRGEMFHEVYEELKNQICANILDEAYVMRAFDTFCSALEAYGLAAESVRKCCFDLMTSVYYICMQTGDVQTGDFSKYVQSLNNVGDINECVELTRNFLGQMIGAEQQDMHDIVSNAKRYINRHLTEELSVSAIAKMLYVSPNYFSRLFKRVTGQGCNEYIVRKRIERACVLLETTNLNTGKIAGMVGYNDTNYFSMAFKKHCGVSPTHYRNNLRNGKESS